MPIPVGGGDTQVLTVPPATPTRADADREESRTMPLGLRVPPGTMSPDRPRRERRTRWLIGAGIVAILLVILGVVLSGARGQVRMPHLDGLSRHAAKVKAEHLGFDPIFRQSQSDLAAGTVIDQLPTAGRRVPEGITIFLTVSSGPVATTPLSPPSPSPAPGHGDHGGKGHGKGHGHEGKD